MEIIKKLFWVEIRIGSKDRKKGWLTRRKAKKKEFVIKYQILCRKAFKHGTGHRDYKTTDGMNLVGTARKELEYNDSTYSGDIYYGLWREYEELIILTPKVR